MYNLKQFRQAKPATKKAQMGDMVLKATGRPIPVMVVTLPDKNKPGQSFRLVKEVKDETIFALTDDKGIIRGFVQSSDKFPGQYREIDIKQGVEILVSGREHPIVKLLESNDFDTEIVELVGAIRL